MTTVEFWGHNRVGTSVTGRIGDKAVSTFVASCYRRRWRDLRVERDGVEVGHIGAHPDSGKRVWWAESSSNPKADPS